MSDPQPAGTRPDLNVEVDLNLPVDARAPPRDSALRRLLRTGRATVLDVGPRTVLETLHRFGPLRFVIKNGAARVEHDGQVEAAMFVAGGATVDMGRQAELWAFPGNWVTTVAVNEPLPATQVSLRFFDAAGQPILEIHNGAGDGITRMHHYMDLWRRRGPGRTPLPLTLPPPDRLREGATAPGLAAVVSQVRSTGQVETLASLSSRHGVSRLQALSMVGAPWVRRLRKPLLGAHLKEICDGRLSVRLSVGNQGVTFVRTGSLTSVSPHDGMVVASDTGVSVTVRPSDLASLWAVQVHSGQMAVTSLEGFDDTGQPALLLSGAPGATGRVSPAWTAFVQRQQ